MYSPEPDLFSFPALIIIGEELIEIVAELVDEVWSKIGRNPDSSWQCLCCSHSSRMKQAMFEHVESKHVTSAGYICPLCNKSARSINALRSHSVRYHGSSSKEKIGVF